MNKDENCRYSENGKCTYLEDNDLQCDGTESEKGACAVYIGYNSEQY